MSGKADQPIGLGKAFNEMFPCWSWSPGSNMLLMHQFPLRGMS